MADNHHAGRSRDPGLQPQRTSLAWHRTLLGQGELLALTLRHHYLLLGWAFAIFTVITLILCLAGYIRMQKINLMVPEQEVIINQHVVIHHFFITLGALALSILAIWIQITKIAN